MKGECLLPQGQVIESVDQVRLGKEMLVYNFLGLLTFCTRSCYNLYQVLILHNTKTRSTSTQTSRILGLLPICFQCLGLDPICTRSCYELYQVQLQTCQPQVLLLRPVLMFICLLLDQIDELLTKHLLVKSSADLRQPYLMTRRHLNSWQMNFIHLNSWQLNFRHMNS